MFGTVLSFQYMQTVIHLRDSLKDITGCDTNLQIGYNYSNDTIISGAYGMQMLQGP